MRTATADFHDMDEAGGLQCRVLRDLKSIPEKHSDPRFVVYIFSRCIFLTIWVYGSKLKTWRITCLSIIKINHPMVMVQILTHTHVAYINSYI